MNILVFIALLLHHSACYESSIPGSPQFIPQTQSDGQVQTTWNQNDFRQHALDIGNRLSNLLRQEITLMSKISNTPVLELDRATVPGIINTLPSTTSVNQPPITTHITINTYQGPTSQTETPKNSQSPYKYHQYATLQNPPSTNVPSVTNGIGQERPIVVSTYQEVIRPNVEGYTNQYSQASQPVSDKVAQTDKIPVAFNMLSTESQSGVYLPQQSQPSVVTPQQSQSLAESYSGYLPQKTQSLTGYLPHQTQSLAGYQPQQTQSSVGTSSGYLLQQTQPSIGPSSGYLPQQTQSSTGIPGESNPLVGGSYTQNQPQIESASPIPYTLEEKPLQFSGYSKIPSSSIYQTQIEHVSSPMKTSPTSFQTSTGMPTSNLLFQGTVNTPVTENQGYQQLQNANNPTLNGKPIAQPPQPAGNYPEGNIPNIQRPQHSFNPLANAYVDSELDEQFNNPLSGTYTEYPVQSFNPLSAVNPLAVQPQQHPLTPNVEENTLATGTAQPTQIYQQIPIASGQQGSTQDQTYQLPQSSEPLASQPTQLDQTPQPQASTTTVTYPQPEVILVQPPP